MESVPAPERRRGRRRRGREGRGGEGRGGGGEEGGRGKRGGEIEGVTSCTEGTKKSHVPTEVKTDKNRTLTSLKGVTCDASMQTDHWYSEHRTPHLASSPGHSQFLSHSCKIKSGSGLGTRLHLVSCPDPTQRGEGLVTSG